jgi:hypothetical protein
LGPPSVVDNLILFCTDVVLDPGTDPDLVEIMAALGVDAAAAAYALDDMEDALSDGGPSGWHQQGAWW